MATYDKSFGTGDIKFEGDVCEVKSDSLTDYAAQQTKILEWMGVAPLASALFEGSGIFTAVGTKTVAATALFNGTSSFDAIGTEVGGSQTYSGLAAFEGQSNFNANGQLISGSQVYAGTATFLGFGSFTGIPLSDATVTPDIVKLDLTVKLNKLFDLSIKKGTSIDLSVKVDPSISQNVNVAIKVDKDLVI